MKLFRSYFPIILFSFFSLLPLNCKPAEHWVFLENNTDNKLFIKIISIAKYPTGHKLYNDRDTPRYIYGTKILYPEDKLNKVNFSRKELINLSKEYKPEVLILEPDEIESIVAFLDTYKVNVDIKLIKKYFIRFDVIDENGKLIKTIDDFNINNFKTKFSLPYPFSNNKSIIYIN